MKSSLVVVALDEHEDLWFGVGDVTPGGGGRPFEFERREEALSHSIVPAVTLPAHALQALSFLEQSAKPGQPHLHSPLRQV